MAVLKWQLFLYFLHFPDLQKHTLFLEWESNFNRPKRKSHGGRKKQICQPPRLDQFLQRGTEATPPTPGPLPLNQKGYLLLALSSVRCLKFREQLWMSWSKACSMLISSFSSCPSCCCFPGRVGSSKSPLPLGTEQSLSVSLRSHPGTPTPGLLCKAAHMVRAKF